MDALLIGYARVSTEEQDRTAKRNALAALGVSAEGTYVDQGLTGTNRERPGLRQAMAACRARDTLVVTKLDRLARSLPDARAILEDLTRRQVKLSLGGAVHDPTAPVGRLLFNVLAVIQATGCLGHGSVSAIRGVRWSVHGRRVNRRPCSAVSRPDAEVSQRLLSFCRRFRGTASAPDRHISQVSFEVSSTYSTGRCGLVVDAFSEVVSSTLLT